MKDFFANLSDVDGFDSGGTSVPVFDGTPQHPLLDKIKPPAICYIQYKIRDKLILNRKRNFLIKFVGNCNNRLYVALFLA